MEKEDAAIEKRKQNQWIGIGKVADLSTSAGASLQRSGMDPRLKAEDDEGVEGSPQ